MKRLLLAALAATATVCLCSTAFAQVCDVTYTSEVETMDGADVAVSSVVLRAVPMADVLDNHRKQMAMLNVASQQQDRGGPYHIELAEYRACDGGAKVKIEDGGVMLLGVTLKGANLIAREGLRQADAIARRYEDRAARGSKAGWDHGKAPKVKRDDMGRRAN